nr:MAG TPA: hypothetical protein [Caudoviricetes sp.]
MTEIERRKPKWEEEALEVAAAVDLARTAL